ncbi:alpha/beta hydrolase [Alkalimonas sp.]|uniref:alpha/beta fold hydrolase n=1 Tax=Alkalimonas sp. TaxID=1872453 RepID=UPI00263B09EF|nr:alpha/beta hydrolase [Alkalimonas sp.]MCC5825035.1 alpha/beta fold hydrolase [Alkalimonas sp.]
MSQRPVVERFYLNTAQGQLHLRQTGSASKPLLLLLHQAPSHSQMYEALMPQLAEHYYCVAPDLPGCGQSDPITAASIGELAACLFGALQQIGSVAAVLGHHTGAAVAAELAAFWLTETKAIILSGPPLLSAEQRQQLQAMQQPRPASEDGQHLQALWQYLRGKDPSADVALTERELCAALRLGSGYPALYQAVAAHDFAGCLSSLRCPALVMAGQNDSLYAAVAPTLALLSQGESADLGQTGTYLFDTDSERVAALIRSFLTKYGI